jgi:hypothetical protein
MLSLEDSVQYLLDRNLVTVQTIIEGDLSITSAARRNRNLRVARRDGPGYLIKQPDDPTLGGAYTLRHETDFYAFCQQEPAAAAMQTLLPRMLYCDNEQTLLAIELFENALPLWGYYYEFDAESFPARVAGPLGRALGVLHDTFRTPGLADDSRLDWLRRDPPWVMQVHKPGPEMLAVLSPANYQTLRILQTQEGLSGHLDSLRRLWKPQAVIHSDIKSDNILVLSSHANDATGLPELRIVDWETVQIGDPAWDLAGALQDFLLFWVSSMNQTMPTSEAMVMSARYPLSVLQPAIRALWRGYRSAVRLTQAEANILIRRATSFSAARIIQSAYELAQNSRDLPVGSVLLLQISANLLADPETGQVQLYGLFQEVGL